MDRQKITLKFIDGRLKKYSGALSPFDDFISIDERRLHPRFVSDVLDMHGKLCFKVVRILSMRISCIVLETEWKLDLGDTYVLKMEGKGRAVNIESVVMWSSSLVRLIETSRGGFVPIHTARLNFRNISGETMKEIIGFIENHRQKINKQRDISAVSGLKLQMRFQIETPEKAILICRQDYRIKNLSSDGMLIVNKNALEIGGKLFLQISRSNIKSIKVVGRVVSCIAIDEGDRAYYEIGIAFLGMMEKDWEMLKEIICLLENMGFIAT